MASTHSYLRRYRLGGYVALLALSFWPDLSHTAETDRAVDHGGLER